MSRGDEVAGLRVRPLRPDDWDAVRTIYRQGIASGDATFERDVPDWERWDAARHPEARLVAELESPGAGAVGADTAAQGAAGSGPAVVGFAALSPVSSRPVYAGVCEVMVYVAEEMRGQGVGSRLLDALVRASEAAGIWTLQAGIFPENTASVRAHERVGFREVGRHERIGRFHDGRWRDTVLLERRSPVVGLD